MFILSLTDNLKFLLQSIQPPTFSHKCSLFLSKVPQIHHPRKADFVSSILIQRLSQKRHLCSPSQSICFSLKNVNSVPEKITSDLKPKMFILSPRKLPQILTPKDPLITSGFTPKMFPTDYPNFTLKCSLCPLLITSDIKPKMFILSPIGYLTFTKKSSFHALQMTSGFTPRFSLPVLYK